MSLNNLAAAYRSAGRVASALPLYQKALQIWEEQLGSDHPQTARTLTELGMLHEQQGAYQLATAIS